MNKLIVIVGPTSSGKTELSFRLADYFNFPILNADAFQVYREISCGTNKPNFDLIDKYKIEMINLISIYQEWNIYNFQQLARQKIKTYQEQKLPVIVIGGSNLYVDALIKNYDLESTSFRSNEFDHLTNQELWERLNQLDPVSSQKIPVQNRRRLLRALEIIAQTRKPKSIKDQQSFISPKQVFLICPFFERSILYRKIDTNVEIMKEKGWVQEVKELLDNDRSLLDCQAFKAIGYQEIGNGILNNTEIQWDLIKQRTRRYAKRQMTWCRNKYQDVFWYQNNFEQLVDKIKQFLTK